MQTLQEESVLFIGPTAMRTTTFALFRARRVLTLFGAGIEDGMAKELSLVDLAGVGASQRAARVP